MSPLRVKVRKICLQCIVKVFLAVTQIRCMCSIYLACSTSLVTLGTRVTDIHMQLMLSFVL